MCAEITRQPSAKRTQVWLCRPGTGAPTLWNSALAVAKSVPKLVITVLSSARCSAMLFHVTLDEQSFEELCTGQAAGLSEA